MDFAGDLDFDCSFCHASIELAPVRTFDDKHHFCNIVCAKLYYDNYERIKVDMTNYQRMYSSGQLSSLSKELYDKMNGTMFYMLPVYKIEDVEDVNKFDARDYYTAVLLNMKTSTK